MVDAGVKNIMEKLSSLSLQEFGLLWGFEDSVKGIKDEFELIKVILEEGEKCIQDKAVELWLRSLRSAYLKIENVLEEMSTEDSLQRMREERGVFRCWTIVTTFFTSNQFVFRLRIAHKVKEIKKTLDDIKKKLDDIRQTLDDINNGPLIHSSSIREWGVMPKRETRSDKPIRVFERAQEVDNVIKKICIQERVDQKLEDREIRVYSIWGMAGVGKTALAQLIYNHQTVKEYFKSLCWVHVSENFQVNTIIKNILESLGSSSEAAQLDTLQSSLKNQLRGKRFLLILDDVWIEEDERHKWDDLCKILRCGNEGSIVVITTRSSTTSRMVAKYLEMQYKLKTLSPDESWLLFTTFAISQGKDADGEELPETIERRMVEECKGLPLALEALGNFMHLKSSAKDGVESNIHTFQQEYLNKKVLPHLKLSYHNLLPHLKRCFSYCCLFPKNTIMVKDEVIELWMSNGFIPPSGNMDLYLLGKEIFICLIRRSFFQVYESHNDTYKIHDLMHDMAKDMIEDDCLVMDPACTDVKIPNEKIHLRSSHPEFVFSRKQLRNLTQLRSILTLKDSIYIPHANQIFNHMYLRVLYLPRIGLTTLPGSICNLKLLKYLNLSESNIEELPESIIYLQNLQVLVLYHCVNLKKFPTVLLRMKGLQHVDIGECTIEDLPDGINHLTNPRRRRV